MLPTAQEKANQQSAVAKALTEDELWKFLDAAKDNWFYALFYTMFSLGLRRGEALGVRLEDLDLEQGHVRIVQQVKMVGSEPLIGPLKHPKSRRRLALSPDLIEVLQEYLRERKEWKKRWGREWDETGLLFVAKNGSMIWPTNVNHTLQRICIKHGLRHISSHIPRHTNITARRRSGEPIEIVSRIAGHSRISTTQDIYRSVFEDEVQASKFSLLDLRKASSESSDKQGGSG